MRRIQDNPPRQPSSRDLSEAERGCFGQLNHPTSRDLSDAEEGRYGRTLDLFRSPEDDYLHSIPPRTSEEGSIAALERPRSSRIVPQALRFPTLAGTPLHHFPPVPWDRIELMLKSSAGANEAVYFLQTHGHDDIVIKPGDHRKQQLLSAFFLRRVGFFPPKMSLIKERTSDFSSLEDLCRRQGFDDLSPLRVEQGRKVTHVIRMEEIKGQTLFDVSFPDSSQLDSDFFTSAFFRELGRLVIFDAFIGNDDRICLSGSHVNMGNIMIDRVSGNLRPIDQEAPLLLVENEDSPSDKTRRRIIYSIPDNASLLADTIANKINLTGGDREERLALIEDGIRQAHAQITNKGQMSAVLEALRKDSPLLDIPPSRLVKDF